MEKVKIVKCPRCGYTHSINLSMLPTGYPKWARYNRPRQIEIECDSCGFTYWVDVED
jgi:predicted nucleic-acid-binding Zn-ribbon protein